MTASLALLALAQEGPIQDALRDAIENSRGLQLVTSLVDLAGDLELSGRTLSIDDSAGTRVTSTILPYRTVLGDPDSSGVRPVVEAGAAYAKASAKVGDLFQGTRPGEELGVDTRWVGYGAQAGGGVEVDLGSGFRIAPVLLLGLHHVENVTHYSGPGTATWPAILDGILFNWQATVFSYGGAVRVEGSWEFGEGLRWTSVLRYDGRWHETLQSTDEAQEGLDPTHILTLRNELAGPFDFTVFDRPLGWSAMLNYRRYVGTTAETLDFTEYLELGAGVQIGVGDLVPVIAKINLGGAVIWGPDVRGWSVGVSVSF